MIYKDFLTKSESQKIHARKRAGQRYGFQLGRDSYQHFIESIQARRNAIHLWKQSNRVSWWAVLNRHEWVPVVYDCARKTIVTFLPPHELDPYRHLLPPTAAVGADSYVSRG